jgi:hypothetical protein
LSFKELIRLMFSIKRFFRSETTLAVLLVALTTVTTYGILLRQLGFYRDDWYIIWTAQAQGSAGLMDLFKIDRPFLGVIYSAMYALLGSTPLYWHVYALVLRLVAALAFLWLLRLIWPDKQLMTTITALLFVVYPGFSEQPNAATYSNLLLGYASAILSFGLTVRAIKVQRVWIQTLLTMLAIITGLLYLLIFESLIGLEVARFALLWYVIHREIPNDLKSGTLRSLKRSIPYFLLAAGFLVWRIFIFQSTRRATSVQVMLSDYSLTPVHSIAMIVIEFAKDIFETSILAWAVPFYQFTSQAPYDNLAASFLLAMAVLGLIAVYYFLGRRWGTLDVNEQASPATNPELMGLGLLIVAVALFPIILAGRNVQFSQQWDRYTYQASIGVAMFLGGFAFNMLHINYRRIFLLGLVVIGVMTQYHSALFYREFWDLERQTWWQLSWRAPGIKQNTVMVVMMPTAFRFAEEYEALGPINIIYYPGQELQVDAQVLNHDTAAKILRGDVDDRTMRSIHLHRDYAKALIATLPFDRNSCLHVIDRGNVTLPFTDDLLTRLVAGKSDPGRLLLDEQPKTPPSNIFGQEPAQTWCYFYEKIDLASQLENWKEAARFSDEALDQGLEPKEASEWMVIFRAYVKAGEAEKANNLVRNIKADKGFVVTYCAQFPTKVDPVVVSLCGSN